MFEENYRHIITRFLDEQTNVEEFIDEFMTRWKLDRDATLRDERFGRMIDQIFTSCDCYDAEPNPSEPFEISEKELRDEVKLLSYIWWGLSINNA